jgi:uncharacterized protein (TIGR03435 family)
MERLISYSGRIAALSALLLSLTFITTAQDQPSGFEVASVKPAPVNRYIPPAVDPQRIRLVATLAGAILWANNMIDHGYQLAGGPQWAHRDYYQIEGKAQAPATRKEMRALLQTLLADRFKLKMHRSTREMSVYALVIGNSGPKLQSSMETCGEDGCINVAPGEFIARYATMDQIASTLSNMVDRPVLDQTGLAGRYDVRLKFDPSSMKRYDGQTIPNTPTDDPSIFVAFQDLGLKLEPRRAVVEVLVIDDAEKPEAN